MIFLVSEVPLDLILERLLYAGIFYIFRLRSASSSAAKLAWSGLAFAEQDRPLPGPGARQRLLLRGRDGQGSTRRLRLARRARPHGAPPPRSFPVHTPRMPIQPHHACANDLPIQPPPPLNTGCAPRYLGRLSRNGPVNLFRSAALGLWPLTLNLWRHLLPEPVRFFSRSNLPARGGSRFFVTLVSGLPPHS